MNIPTSANFNGESSLKSKQYVISINAVINKGKIDIQPMNTPTNYILGDNMINANKCIISPNKSAKVVTRMIKLGRRATFKPTIKEMKCA